MHRDATAALRAMGVTNPRYLALLADTCRRTGRAKLYELRAATSLARLWRDQGKNAEARNLFAPNYGWFTEGFDTPVLQDAKAPLDS